MVPLHLLLALGALGLPAGAAGLVAPAGQAEQAPATEELRYGRDVRPILADRCFQCHGADSAERQAELRLDLAGNRALVPGDPAASELVRRIETSDPDDAMPPARAKKRPLAPDERAVLRRWIAAGAEYEPHWAFVAPARPALPEVDDPAWPAGPLDRFVLARLERADLSPSPPADADTLARRAFLDVTGLPPTPSELDAFRAAHADDAEQAWAELVERLLTEEPYVTRAAEHVAVTWLDAARYADTIGIHTDNGRQLWPWRDWLIGALQANLSYDRFATQLLAGDLLPEATLEQRVASGFNRAHVLTDEGGAIDEEYLFEYAVDRVDTTAAVFLGLTAGCARCHDHKYDPLTQADYYGLLAFFNSNDEPGLYSQTPDARRAYEPFVEVPSDEQRVRLEALEAELERLSARLDEPLPGEDPAWAAFGRELTQDTGLDWRPLAMNSASSSDPSVTLTVEDGATVQASGPMPDTEDYQLLLDQPRGGQRLLLLEALATPGAGPGGGRDTHGNAVLTGVRLEARGAQADGEWRPHELLWAWADHTQKDRDYEPVNVIEAGDRRGWALDGNDAAGERDLLLLLASAPPAGSELRLTLEFRSVYPRHSLGRVRVRSSALASTEALPVAAGRWYRLGPIPAERREGLHERRLGPERLTRLDLETGFGPEEAQLEFEGDFDEGRLVLPGGPGTSFLARELWSPDRRTLELALGSDDGLCVHLNGAPVFERRVDRALAEDQDRVALELAPGHNLLVLEVVNTGGEAGVAYRPVYPDGVLAGELAAALLPEDARSEPQAADLRQAWRRGAFAGWRELDDARTARAAELEQARAEVPRTMVMRELDEPRPSFVMQRGQYDHPDPERPAPRSTPGFLPPMPPELPRDRLGLARWLALPENPLFARVAVNRVWQQIFGQGLVRTPGDLGLQGAWPTHPELLDWLAVELRESGWDLRALRRRILSSRTYRQASTVRPELAEADPEGRLLGAYPRRRLSAEQLRDLALHASGLLVERTGGPPVRPYQPAGLWREVSMPASNTREFARDEGEGLWRRSLYTYWKRAVPPPAMQTFDAPTRETCVLQRQATNTPLQALVLWNDEQFVEAARALAVRALAAVPAGGGTDGEDRRPDAGAGPRVDWLFETCAARRPEPDERALVLAAVAELRARYRAEPADAEALIAVGAAPPSSPGNGSVNPEEPREAAELAAWTLAAAAVLNLHETLTQD